MINAAINQLAVNLDESLGKTFNLDEQIVVVSSTVESDGSMPLSANNKVALSPQISSGKLFKTRHR